jgi:hypothetical protein
MPAPKPVLKAGIVYSADNGRLICLRCAGASAKFTGRDLSGQKVAPLRSDDAEAREWFNHFGKPLACEIGCTVYPKPAK